MKRATPVRRPFLAATPDFAAGRDTPRAYLERCLERIDELEPSISAFVALSLERARVAWLAALETHVRAATSHEGAAALHTRMGHHERAARESVIATEERHS